MSVHLIPSIPSSSSYWDIFNIQPQAKQKIKPEEQSLTIEQKEKAEIPYAEISRAGGIDTESLIRITKKINNLMEDLWSRDDEGNISAGPQTLEESGRKVAVWPNGDAVLLTDTIVGRGLEKTVYIAIDLKNGKRYASGFAEYSREIETQNLLKNKRGIAQIHHHMLILFKNNVKTFFYGELYDKDLSLALDTFSLTTEDIKVIVKDLLYAILALEGEDPKGDWILHDDLKDKNVFLKIDKTTRNVLGAYLGDFGRASKCKTREIDAATLKSERKKYGDSFYPSRETQRKAFMQSLFHQLKTYLERELEQAVSLEELVADDPVCKKLMGEMEREYGYILERPYFHWED